MQWDRYKLSVILHISVRFWKGLSGGQSKECKRYFEFYLFLCLLCLPSGAPLKSVAFGWIVSPTYLWRLQSVLPAFFITGEEKQEKYAVTLILSSNLPRLACTLQMESIFGDLFSKQERFCILRISVAANHEDLWHVKISPKVLPISRFCSSTNTYESLDSINNLDCKHLLFKIGGQVK